MNMHSTPNAARTFRALAVDAAFAGDITAPRVSIQPDPADVRSQLKPAPDHPGARLLDEIAQLNALYARRNAVLGAEDFHDPRWHVLLTVAEADIRMTPLTVTDCSMAADIPASTTIRTLRQLERDGFITRTRDAVDQRRIYVHLTARAMQRLVDVFRKES